VVGSPHTDFMPEAPVPPGGGPWRPSRRTVLIGSGAAVVVVAAGIPTALALAPHPPAALVTTLLESKRFTAAHHGGSLDWPEESLYAYRRATRAGVDALEVSLARSSDGVWFGLHDATLDRTSGTHGFTASEHTWAEIKTHRILPPGRGDPAQASRPYARFDDILDEYGESHALFVDPKVVPAEHFDELFDLVAKHVRNPLETMIAKGYCTSLPWARAAKKRGFQTWGYYYANEIAAKPDLLTSTEAVWTVLGLDYTGAADQWQRVTALGKPVIGHVVPNAAAAEVALGLGARGLMISGITETLGHLAG
jgi:hypothetical protein